jgi:hypothetical protein
MPNPVLPAPSINLPLSVELFVFIGFMLKNIFGMWLAK